MKKFYLAILSFLFFPGYVLASPNVDSFSGGFANGQSVSINGSLFGTHAFNNESLGTWKGASYLPATFKDFEDGQIISQGFTGNYLADIVINSGGPLNSSKYGKIFYNGSRLADYGIKQSKNNNKTIFSSFWFMMPNGTEGGKPWRWYFGSDSSSDNLYIGTMCGSNAFNLSGDFTHTTVYGAKTISYDMWHKVEIYASEPNDVYKLWVDGNLYLDWAASKGLSVWNISHNVLSPNGHTVETPNMIDGTVAGCATTGSYNYDDIYEDYTPARVEICSGSTWGTRGLCNTQIPTQWSDNSINVMVNQGTFGNSQNAYLYVVDSNNNASSPKMITFGSGAVDAVAPKIPTGLVVN